MKKHMFQAKRMLSLFLAIFMLLAFVPGQTFAADSASSEFLNGPYLLAPKSDGMVVVWELEKAMKSTISYGVSADAMQTLDVAVEEGSSFQGKPMYLYRARLTGLTPASKYTYTVTLENGTTASGSFRTLSENPDEVRFVVISDSHRFETVNQVSDAIEKFDPDFILHTGDLVEGTGSQKDQFSYWFNNVGSFLHNVPVLYNAGNHDVGVYFDEYVTKVQKEQYSSNETGGNISFNYGGAHFAMLDSNPWSLFELNSSVGGKVDPATKAVVDESLDWLKNDLASEDAKNADFRILTMHHPYEDTLTNKYIPPIAEAGNVNVMFSGHTHVYSRYASANAQRGADTLYVTQGDARIGDGKIDTGTADVRMDSNYPELLATGKGDMLEVTIKDGLLTFENLGLEKDSQKVYETITLSKNPGKLSYSDISISPDRVQSNGEVTVSAKVTNVGDGLATANLHLKDNGKDRYLYHFGQAGKERVVTLNPGESATLTGKLAMTELGKHTLQIADYRKQVDVTFREATYAYDNLRVKLGSESVSDETSDVIHAKADVKNIGNAAGTATAVFYVNDKSIESKSVTLAAGQTRTVEFTYDAPTGGTYQVKIGTSEQKPVSIIGAIQGTPIVRDQSGLGNDGIIRGNPTLVKSESGWGLSLDGVDDYVEIPDRKNYVVDDGVTGMVWANIDRLAAADEWDHNPLLVKGASISYGTNYLYRMAVRKTGMLTYGIGFDNDNGEYFWNDDDFITGAGAQLGKWTQYTGGFDRKTGGTSWENGKLSGEITAPDYDSDIRNWEGKSMYSGFSFHRHLLNDRGRGKTHTMLTGDIGQIRFYTTKLTEAENKAIYENPTAKGAHGDKLVVWLDFNPANIVSDGTHTTEWRPVIGDLKRFSYNAAVSGKSSAKAVVETSNDGKTLKQSKTVDLSDGTGTLDLSDLEVAQFVRVSTTLHSSVAEDATDVPVLKSYTVDAGNQNVWATLADWNAGTFTGAAGYASEDVFVDYATDYDDYSGTADVSKIPVGSDVPKSHWAYSNIQTLAQKEILHGDSPTGNVRPDERITREEVVTVLLNALNVTPESSGELSAGDPSSAWAKNILLAAKARGILTGDEKGNMNGQLPATRAEVAIMIARVADIAAGNPDSLSEFSDHASVPDWAREGLAGMLDNHMINGYEDNTIRPNASITRAETFTLITNLLK